MCLGQYMSNTELLDLWQLCEINEKQYNMGPFKLKLYKLQSTGKQPWVSIPVITQGQYHSNIIHLWLIVVKD